MVIFLGKLNVNSKNRTIFDLSVENNADLKVF